MRALIIPSFGLPTDDLGSPPSHLATLESLFQVFGIYERLKKTGDPFRERD